VGPTAPACRAQHGGGHRRALRALIVGTAIFADALAPRRPDEQNFDLIEAAPGWTAPFGTDRFGRDVLSRVVHGSRISLYVAAVSISIAMGIGGVLGLNRGVRPAARGTTSSNRVMDVFFSIPGLLLAVGIAAMARTGGEQRGRRDLDRLHATLRTRHAGPGAGGA